MAATLADQIAASHDADLLQRYVAAAEMAGIDAPQQWVEANRGKLVAAPVDSEGNTVSSVYAYALATYAGRPGENPAAVTDDQIKAALAAVQGGSSPA